MRELLTAGLQAWGLATQGVPELEEFASLLLQKNEVMNLTAITEPDRVARLHLLDSLTVAAAVELRGKKLIDVGCGAGFPGLPLHLVQPDFDLTLLDSLGKRITFLQECCSSMQLSRVTCVHARAEEYALEHREAYDIATSRAVAALPLLCELCLPLVKVGGVFLAMKSVDTESELRSARHAVEVLGGEITSLQDYTIPGTEVTHRVVVIEKRRPTPAKYPRAFAKMKKAPL